MSIQEQAFRICPICEAGCGLTFTVDQEKRTVNDIRGYKDDVFSKGFICPKGVALKELHDDPDRIRVPLIKKNGVFEEASWDDAFALIRKKMPAVQEAYGRNAIGVYMGNPGAHKASLSLYQRHLLRALGTHNLFSASTVDQMPKQLSNGLMFGTWVSVPVPDIERSDLIVMLGANPFASNGSLFTVPDFRGHLRRMQERGGKLVVIDPRRSETARKADSHHFIRPGTDAWFLLGIVNVLFDDNLVSTDPLTDFLNGLTEIKELAQRYPVSEMSKLCGIDENVIRKIANDLVKTEKACVYGRIGTTAQSFGTLTSWLVDVVNILTGNLDKPGCAMFPKAPAFAANTVGEKGKGRGIIFGRRHSRVSGFPEVATEFPAVALAEEIRTPGEGQIKGLFTIAGNPVLSVPNGPALSEALEQLDFMVSVDIYLNETTRHADVILPGASPFEEPHYDTSLSQFQYRNVARFSPALFEMEKGRPQEWQVILTLTGIMSGQMTGNFSADDMDDALVRSQVESLCKSPKSPIHGRDPDEIYSLLGNRRGPIRQVDLALRTGPFGDHFDDQQVGANIDRLLSEPKGMDFGSLMPRVPESLRTESGKIELAPSALLEDLRRLDKAASEKAKSEFLLIGRRHVRSNNSWLHNVPVLAKGPEKCTMQIHPADATKLGLLDGGKAEVRARTGVLVVPVELSEDLMPGVVSIPHGYGHVYSDTRMSVASERPGVNCNILTDPELLDVPSGTSVLNGVPVSLSPA